MKRLWTYLISMPIFRLNIFKTKQKSTYKVDFNFIFISTEKNILEIFKIREPIKTKHTCYNVKIAVYYSMCAIKFWLVPGFSPNNLGYLGYFFSWNENKIEINFIFWLLLCFKAIWSRNSHWNRTSTQTFHKITFNTIILARRALKFLDLNILSKNFITLRTKITVLWLVISSGVNFIFVRNIACFFL